MNEGGQCTQTQGRWDDANPQTYFIIQMIFQKMYDITYVHFGIWRYYVLLQCNDTKLIYTTN